MAVPHLDADSASTKLLDANLDVTEVANQLAALALNGDRARVDGDLDWRRGRKEYTHLHTKATRHKGGKPHCSPMHACMTVARQTTTLGVLATL